jgi:hypothetical protein
MIYARLHNRDTKIPTFSLDGGVILNPAKIHAFCGYGLDGSIDDNKPLSCASTDPSTCVPGCGRPPAWCRKDNPHDEGAWATCGLGWTGKGVRPWRPEEFGGRGGLFDLVAQQGDPFTGVGNYKGYNEVVLDSEAWIEGLPESIEAIFMVDCSSSDPNLLYGGADGGGTARSCDEAHRNAIALHRSFLENYHLSAADFPLLKLQPSNWNEPFVTVPDANSDVHGSAAPRTATPHPAPVIHHDNPGVRCHTCDRFRAPPGKGMTSDKCTEMLRDRNGKLWQMWALDGWKRRTAGQAACFETGWQHFDFDQPTQGCARNWLQGTHATPEFPTPAPALLGFDDTIYAYCSAKNHQNEGPFYQDNKGLANRCTDANENVLRVMGGWNMCLNLQWQTCAMHGRLHGQGNKKMHFSIAPKDLDIDIFRNVQQCVGGSCDVSYAISDVYFGEVCVTSQVCRNKEELFALEVGDLFECDFDQAGFQELRSMLSGTSG